MNKFEKMRLKMLLDYLDEDAGRGDITTESLGISGKCKARVIAKQNCITAGLDAVAPLLKHFKIEFKIKTRDGRKCKTGSVVMELEGDGAVLLQLERLLLNIISRMSGIATSTREIVDIVSKTNPDCVIAATRKTTPGFRTFEKEAVLIGGGNPHRYDLAEAVLIKDNHLKFFEGPDEALGLSITFMNEQKGRVNKPQAWGSAKPGRKHKLVEIEADNYKDAVSAVEAGADIVMLDNMRPAEVKRTYKKLKSIRENIQIEISGGITKKNIASYAKYADIISLGWLTHSAPAIDFSMKIAKVY